MRDFFISSCALLLATAMIANAMNTDNNPLLANWEGPYGGVPPFDRVQIALFKPALEAAMAEQLTEIEKIANNSAPPDFENTIVALERTGEAFDRVGTLYSIWGSTMASPEYQAVQREMAPRERYAQQHFVMTHPFEKSADTKPTENSVPSPGTD